MLGDVILIHDDFLAFPEADLSFFFLRFDDNNQVIHTADSRQKSDGKMILKLIKEES